jgi:membrane-associated phospholipid phosphatase
MALCRQSPPQRYPARLAVALLLLTANILLTVSSFSQDFPRDPYGQADVEIQGKSPVRIPDRTIPSFKQLPGDILNDQKVIWSRPFHLKRKDVRWGVAILGTTAALITIDKRVGQNLADSPPGTGFGFSRRVGQASGILPQLGLCSVFYVLGRHRGNEKWRSSGLLGMRAVLDSAITVEILKTVTQRPRPTEPDGVALNHNADGQFFTGGNSFPSGHAAEAFALATVISSQYGQTQWVPPTAYSLAGLVAVCRVTRRRHFPSDVFVGAVLGYLIGRHVSHEASTEGSEKVQHSRLLPDLALHDGTGFDIIWRF